MVIFAPLAPAAAAAAADAAEVSRVPNTHKKKNSNGINLRRYGSVLPD